MSEETEVVEKVTLPKGTTVLILDGSSLTLAEDSVAVLSREMPEEEFAGLVVAAGKPELLQCLKGRFTQQGTKVEIPSGKQSPDETEVSRKERQRIENDRLKKEKAKNKAADEKRREEEAEIERKRQEAEAERLAAEQAEKEKAEQERLEKEAKDRLEQSKADQNAAQ